MYKYLVLFVLACSNGVIVDPSASEVPPDTSVSPAIPKELSVNIDCNHTQLLYESYNSNSAILVYNLHWAEYTFNEVFDPITDNVTVRLCDLKEFGVHQQTCGAEDCWKKGYIPVNDCVDGLWSTTFTLDKISVFCGSQLEIQYPFTGEVDNYGGLAYTSVYIHINK